MPGSRCKRERIQHRLQIGVSEVVGIGDFCLFFGLGWGGEANSATRLSDEVFRLKIQMTYYMKEVYLAYFDFLGFKEFILNNDDDTLSRRMSHIYRDIEMALSKRDTYSPKNGVVYYDISNSKINCLNISDTVIFWTSDTDADSLKELIEVAYNFNRFNILYNFPVRGSIIKGKIKPINDYAKSEQGATYTVSSLYGEGLVRAHIKAESQNWAGTVIDSDILKKFNNLEEAQDFLQPFAIKYTVPYKTNSGNSEKEYVLKLVRGVLNDESRENITKNIIGRFEADNKKFDSESVQSKIQNTLDFLNIFLIKE